MKSTNPDDAKQSPDLEGRVEELEAAVKSLSADRHWLTARLAELTFELQPSGELIPLGVKDGDEELNECLEEAVIKLRLPEGTVFEAKSISISHR